MQFNSSNLNLSLISPPSSPNLSTSSGTSCFFVLETSPPSNTTLSSHLRIWRSMDPSGLRCSTAASEKIYRHLHRHLIYENFWKSKNMRYLYPWNIWKFMNIWFSIDAQSVTSWEFLPFFNLFCSCKLLGVSWIPWIPWRHFSFTWRWRSTCGPSWLLLNLGRGLSLKSLRHLEEGVSNQSFVASLYW